MASQRNDRAVRGPTGKGLDQTQQLVALQGMTERLGVLHDAQVLQLKMWPFAVDPELAGASAEVDIPAKRLVMLWLDPKKPNGFAPKGHYLTRLKHLARSVKLILLGAAWSFEVQMNGAVIYTSAAGVVDEIPESSRSRARKRKGKQHAKSKRRAAAGARRKSRR